MMPDLERGQYPLYLPNNPSPALRPRLLPRSSRVVGPLRTKTEFQQYAEDTTGRQLPVYGRQLFDQIPTTFAPVENVPVPADYVLGPDDQLLIRAWGKIDLNTRVTIDRNGQISLAKVGTLTVAGLHYSQVESYLKTAIGRLYKDFELNVTIGQLRSIQVYVLGNARQPGAFTISSLSTLVDALFWSAGPSATGTMRDIQLRRDGKTISDFDLYDLIARGDKSKDVRLLPGDVIFIPSIGPQVAITGDVNEPGIFELRGSTAAGAAIALAGGMTSLASIERAVIERVENHSSRTVTEFSLDTQGQARQLNDGDILRVFPLSPKFANAVTLRGNVAVPGLYSWREGMRVSDLIPSRSMLITRDYWNKQNHLVQPVALRPFSASSMNAVNNQQSNQQSNTNAGAQTETQTGPQTDMGGESRVDAFGNPRKAATGGKGIENSENQDASQSSDQSGGGKSTAPSERGGVLTQTITSVGKNSAEINWEYALIERLDERDLSTHLIPFRLASAIDEPGSADNQALRPGDVVTIFSRADLELPMEKHASFVRVGGEVNAPGIYRVDPGATLRDVVGMAGGLTKHSYLYAAIFTRVSTRLAQEEELRQSSEQMQRELAAKFANASTPGMQPGQLSLQQDALAKLTAIKPTGRVVMAMKTDAKSVADIPNIPLEDGDALYVPPILSTVQVAGAVYNTNAFRYVPGASLSSYLSSAGGPTREADSHRMFVIRADGTVISRQSRRSYSHVNFDKLRLLPGDSIIVPTKLKIGSKTAEIMQWTQLMSQMALTAAALSVVVP
jgi:protein involved in polysaccharide export with SLBB domain